MWSPFKKKEKETVNFAGLYCDMHSHLIPGIDDGAKDMETSIALAKGFAELGYKKIVTTPHILWDLYKNTNDIILQGAEKVKAQLAQNNIPLEFSAAAEYYIDDHFQGLLESEHRFLTLKDNLVLVEFSFIQEPRELKKILFNMQVRGYQPVIAHPERYLYFSAKKDWYDEMKNAGCLFQLNILSLSGFYGKLPQQLAQWLLKKEYINLLGSDLHNAYHIEMLKSAPPVVMDTINRLLDQDQLLNPKL